MSLKKITQVKADKGFKILDLIVYGVVILLIVTLFISFAVTKDKSPLKGVEVYVSEKFSFKYNLVFTYDFESDEYDIKNAEAITVTEDNSFQLKIKILTGDDGYNDVLIDKTNKYVDVTDANCSKFSKDCVYSPKIADVNTAILCAPHGVQIKPVGYYDEDSNNVII
jgi:hypothetical protein